jgi:hypothetical protein
MTTNFEGVRQSKFISAPNTEITADLDIDLNEISDVPKIEFTNLTTVSGFGVREGIAPNDLFDFDANFGGATGLSNFRNLGVTNYTDAELTSLITSLTVEFNRNQIITNTQVTMLLSAMLANSENLLNKEMPWDDPKKEERVVKFPSNDPIGSGQTRYYNYVSGLGILSSVPTAVTGLDREKAYQIAGNEDLNEFKENDNIESKRKELLKERNALDPNIGDNAEKIFLINKALSKLDEEDKNQINTTTYYNIFDGDAYRFRPRGFLYIVGRKQYFQLYEEFNKSGEVSIESPFRLSDSVDSAIQTSIVQWKYFKGLKGNNPQTSYFYTSQKNNGTLATYKKCLDTAHQYSPPKSDKSIETFQNVLTIFVGKDGQPLIDYFKPA